MSNKSENTIRDVIIIGGGPAGMMAAGRAVERGKSVLLLEKNPYVGKKLLITGGGRCNVTNNKPELASLVSSYKNTPKALYSVFSQFGVEDTLEFFHSKGMATKLEAEGRIFPESNKAQSVWNVLNEYINNEHITLQTNAQVTGISQDENKNFVVKLKNDSVIGTAVVVATGGTSHPETGSTGDGFKWLKSLGHTIVESSFALVPVALKDAWVKNIAGVALSDVSIRVYQDGKKQASKEGKLLFTHFGISGPAVLNLSSQIGELLQYGEVNLELDLLPQFDGGMLKTELHTVLTTDINKKIKNTLNNLIPSGLVLTILQLANVDPEKANNSITKEERLRLVKILKAVPLNVKHLLGSDKAIVSSGGININEIDFKTMQSRLVPNLFIIGDVIDIDRPSGGYSLQLCWSQGFVAGSNC
ncbi:MAG: aminoacetone oxidase family FAD-binding enzyme [Bacteroidota bacterium]|nr:aminoacetone oxidase family FAD-binding enzyme [Bacteroidota bacterium]